jgi:hypothetical protein
MGGEQEKGLVVDFGGSLNFGVFLGGRESPSTL